MPHKQDHSNMHISVPITIIYTALFAISGFLLSLNTRVAVLEASEPRLERSITDMSAKIDKIYDRIYEHESKF